MTSSRKVTIGVIAAIGLAAVIAVFLWSRKSEQASLQAALSRAFHRPSQYIELNLPPADGRYPGAVMLMPRPGQELPLLRAYRPDRIPDFTTSLQATMSGEAEAALAGSEPLTWGGFLESIVDVKPVGEMRIHGTFSWSDFDAADELPMLREIAP